MSKLLLMVAVIFAAGSARASDKTDVMAAVHQFIDGFNKGDVKAVVAACADPASIVDEFPPYVWQGAKACADWATDFDANSKKEKITDPLVTLGKARHVDVTGDRAYVVLTANYTYKQNGKEMAEPGSSITIALQKVAAVWRMTGWAWSKH